jgi:hypothetical protein
MLNAHIENKDGWRFNAGQPFSYLKGLRDGKAAVSVFPPERQTWPEGKFRFENFVTGNGGRATHSCALVVGGKVQHGDFAIGDSVGAFLAQLPPGRYFCKPDNETGGAGAMRLDVPESGLSPDERERFAAALSATPYVVQDWLVPQQHPAVAGFNPAVLNTLRVVTFDTPRGAVAVSAALRSGTSSAVVDNWAAGGLMVPVDLARGTLHGVGVYKDGVTLTDSHPSSGERFDGRPIPFLREACRLACALHEKLAVPSLGWDIGLLQDGPCIVECNRDYYIYFSAQLEPEFVKTFLAYHLPEQGRATVRIELTGHFRQRNLLRYCICAFTGRALASGRVDYVSDERLVMTVDTPRSLFDAMLAEWKQMAGRFAITRIKTERSADTVAPGLDIAACFAAPSLQKTIRAV